MRTFSIPATNSDGVAQKSFALSVSGSNVSARYDVATSRRVSFAPITVATRDAAGNNVDFGHSWETVDGRRSFTASKRLSPGTYRSWIAYTIDGQRWVDLGTPKTFTVTGEATPPADPGTGTDPSGDAGPTPPPDGGWRLAFGDEFNDTIFDTSKWDWKYPRSDDMIYSNWGNGEAQWYKRDNISEDNGSLKLAAKREDTTSPYSGRTFNYSSGLIQSKPSFNFRYGYMETRMWLPKGSGFWPAFWTWSTNEQWPPEIDAMEFYGDNPALTYLTYHSPGGSDGTQVRSADWTTGWHTFAVDWQPGRLTWYVDGVARKTVNQSPSIDMYLIANLAIANGERAPAPNSSTPLPSALKIDYIRVWQR